MTFLFSEGLQVTVFPAGETVFAGVSLSSQMARTAPTECFFSEVEMATTEFGRHWYS